LEQARDKVSKRKTGPKTKKSQGLHTAKRLTITLPYELHKQLESIQGDKPMSALIAELVKKALPLY